VKALAICLAALVLASCGGSSSSDERPTIFAASSLTGVLQDVSPGARFNFAGSDELATQLREGAKADVYAAASTRYPAELHAEGLVGQPRVFARNRLVLLVPPDNPARIGSITDLVRPGIKLVVAQRGVPAGDYTRAALDELGESRALRNVVSEETDVEGVVGKVALGEADAGFAYATDARADRSVRAIPIPATSAADVRYAVAIVHAAEHPAAARRFVERLLGPAGRSALRSAGFALP
jgi:molybdate transport system substrate-binding protein